MYNTIIVTTDCEHEELTIQSLKKAEQLSEAGRIILLHVIEALPTYALVEVPLDLIPDLTPAAKNTLEEWLEKSAVNAEVEIRQGSAHYQIIESSKKNKADLVLINSHRPGLQDYLLGSTASKVVLHAPCAVLVIR